MWITSAEQEGLTHMFSRTSSYGNSDETMDLPTRTIYCPSGSSTDDDIDVWESEGGSSSLPEGDPARGMPRDAYGWWADISAGWLAKQPNNAMPKDRAMAQLAVLGEKDDKILRCLGAAVILRWNRFPTMLQKELFDNGSSIGELLEPGALRAESARFLHTHKDAEGRRSSSL